MKTNILKALLIGLLLIVLPMKHFGQQPRFVQHESTIDFDITEINVFEERIVFIYNLINDCRFEVLNSERDGVFIISANPDYEDLDLAAAFSNFLEQNTQAFSQMDKETLAEASIECKSKLPENYIHSLMMDVYIQSRQNNHCNTADPFCTDNGMYQFPAGVNAGSGESGPNYNCLSTRPNPAWYYMRIGNPGSINIYMYSTPSVDIDFCCWGPFEDPVAPCPNGLTGPKVVSCSYSPSPTENCVIPSNAQTGQYYILVITNFSNQTCNINFSKTSGNGTTDCGIMPPLVNNDGPFCVGDAIHLSANGQAGASYSWTGPNGYTSNQQNPTISNANMSHSGSYTCTITLNGQSNNASTQVRVYAKPTANFTATSVCKGEATQFTSTCTTNPSGQAINSYLWNFGDGQTSTQQNPTHIYAEAGEKTVSLTVGIGSDACTHTKTKTVTVYSIPVANAGNDQTIIYGATAQLNGSGGGEGYLYHWEPANKVVNPDAQSTATVGLQQSTTFTLTVTHPQGGCSSTDQVSILVEGSNMTATASATPTSICLGDESQLQAIAVGGTQSYTYSWTPTLGLSAPNIANPKASPTTTTTYSCVVSDGMSTQTVSTTVTVNQPEYSEETHYICPGDTYTFYGQDYSEEGNYDYHTTTSQGCEKTITLHLRHYPSYPNADVTEAAICPGLSYPFHGQYFNTTGMHPVNLQTTLGCDSIVWLNLLVYPPNDTTIVDPTICTSQTYNFHGTLYNHDGDIAYFDTIDSHGCLKVEKLVLSVGPYQMPPIQNQYECYGLDETPSYYWDKTGQTYTQDSYDEIILPDPEGGCDIKYRLNLKFHQEFFHQEERTECDNYYWPVNGETYSRSGHYVAPFPIGGGPNFNCDSTYVLDLTVNYKDVSSFEVLNQCDEYEWQFGWNNESYILTEQADYTKVIPTHLNCDSIVTLSLQLDYSPTFPEIIGKHWVVGGSEFQFTIEQYRIQTHPKSTHSTDWKLYDHEGNLFNKWEILPYGNGDKCMLYIYTFERDSIRLHVETRSTGECECGGDEKDFWIHCGYHDTDENYLSFAADIYPNPNDGNMTLSFDNLMGDVFVYVHNITGSLLDQFTVHNVDSHQTYTYQSKELLPGVYFFTIITNKGKLTKKVIIFD